MHPRVSHTGIEAPAKLAVRVGLCLPMTVTPILGPWQTCTAGFLMRAIRCISECPMPMGVYIHRGMFTHSCLRGHNEGRCRECVFALISQCVFTGTPTLLPGGGVLEGGLAGLWCTATAAPRVGAFLGRACVLIMSLDLSWQTIFDVFSGRNLCAHRVLVHQDIRLMQLDAHTARVPPPLHRRRSATGDEEAASTGSENPPGICEARCLSRLRRALRFSRRVPLARAMPDNESSRCFVRSSYFMRGPPLSLTRRAPPGAGRDPLEEMFGVRMVDHESLFFVFFETFGSCDSQLDCLLRCAVLTPFPPYSASVAGVSSAVLRACCASVHSFLVWVCLGKRLLGYPTRSLLLGVTLSIHRQG
ncbi:hypothetical protein PAPYR_11196 [Paratrimastix pyriformis]|uniref:Uncharacterized protein n=1 Tax=Paratrimastix pyriformis TaxID=342808 RepID=A0ABQ8U9B7_9EUKA|nr:hypothetical protein PAPYR_11196 [Paratrimastix pyriformis]